MGTLQDTHQPGTILSEGLEHVKFDNSDWWNLGKGLQNGIQLTVIWMMSFTFTMQTQGLTKSMLLMCHPIARIKLWVHSITSNFCRTTYVMQSRRSIHNWLKVPQSCLTILQSAQQTVLKMFSIIDDGKFYSTLPILVTSVHVIMIWFPNWSSHCVGNDCWENTLTLAQISVSGSVCGVYCLPQQWQITIYNFGVSFEGC